MSHRVGTIQVNSSQPTTLTPTSTATSIPREMRQMVTEVTLPVMIEHTGQESLLCVFSVAEGEQTATTTKLVSCLVHREHPVDFRLLADAE